MEEYLVKIGTYFNQFDVDLAKFKLEENGIFAFIRNENVAQLQFGMAHFELLVYETDKTNALKILEVEP
ncbi:MAG TPA: DUF2007 domain-containing protein [Chitinophagales bacterium]|jgi:hypothetical protein|nr:DUF2007 domain-containing protein [Chitinophagales bacterium]HQV78625.1 DUF2007 domain-containing protein [Chitinophagales bacterium]HQW78989.1 DUF2007 domain-containing protein [Chitinophagales bacterium]HRB19148.1 DUF2007 domain-containing protein [Chitinophagales bacterium]HRB66590.1 DUF2007 domain-containing protein [Chitinophagales bacterium]